MQENYTISETQTVRDQVAEILRKMLASGQFEPGQRLVERTLSEQLKVSTTPIKEAFRLLESEGLLYTVPRKGSFVSDCASGNMLQITHARSVMEGTAAYFAVLNLTDEGIQKIESVLAECKRLTELGKIDELAVNNLTFHQLIRNACNHDYILKIIKNLSSMDHAIRDVSLHKDAEEPYRAYLEHHSILEAIKLRDPALTEQRMVTHIRRVADFTLK